MFGALWRVDVTGGGNVPGGGAVIAANHQSVIDSFFLGAFLPRPIVFLGKAEYLDDWKTRRLFPALGMIPLDRSGGESAAAALSQGAQLLSEGRLLGVYPEGTRSRTGRLHRGRTGIARLAFAADVPVVPVGIIGTREIQPPDAPLPKPFMRAELRIGEPVRPDAYRGRVPAALGLRAMTDDVMFAIRELTGLVYDPTYAQRPGAETAPPDGGESPDDEGFGPGRLGDDRPSSTDALRSESSVTPPTPAVA